MNQIRRSALFGALILALVAAPTAGFAAEENTGLGNEAGLGALSALSTLIYGPVKIVYATMGLLIGGTAWCLSGGDSETFDSVITASVRGDYVVTPAMLRMEQPIEFIGREPQYREVAASATPATSAAPPDAVFASEDY